MSFLAVDKTLMHMDADYISLEKDIPAGIYKYGCGMMGPFIEKYALSLEHSKVYGKALSNAEHIIKAYEASDKSKNFGVLLSGGKGLGKSLTAKLIIERLKDTHPVIIVEDFDKCTADFLSHVGGAVILFDEYEKNVTDEVADNQVGPSAQEQMLSVLDGTSGKTNNLYILTVNQVHNINEHLLSRPGRIRYHYRYQTTEPDTIREYCKDNLTRKELTEEIVESLCGTRFVSLDIVQALVSELNLFPDVSVNQAIEYLNIEYEQVVAVAEITAVDNNTKATYTATTRIQYHKGLSKDTSWYYTSDYIDEEGHHCGRTAIGCYLLDLSEVGHIPLVGSVTLPLNKVKLVGNDDDLSFTVVKCTIKDEDAAETVAIGYDNAMVECE